MRLEKWYADSVVDGQVRIFYRADLRLGPLVVSYSGQVGEKRETQVRIGTTGIAMPSIKDGKLYWRCAEMEHPWVWLNAYPQPMRLWEERTKSVVWNPVVLNGSVSLPDGVSIGRGYAERLTLEIAPWRLGMSRLKWGRFCGETHSLVWIEWEGEIPRKIALLNGQNEELVSADRAEICTEHARLKIDNPQEIVCESLGAGALKALGPLRIFAASKFLSGIETKWLANADLECAEKTIDRGSVVYEEVVWR